MIRWIFNHPGLSASLIVPCSAWTMIYGVGHLVSAFGMEFPYVSPGRPYTHLILGASLLIAGIVSFSVGKHLSQMDRSEVDDTPQGRRRRASKSIWQRAKRNKPEETHPQGH